MTPLAFHPHPLALSSLPSRRLDQRLDVSLERKQGSSQVIPRRQAWAYVLTLYLLTGSQAVQHALLCGSKETPCLGRKRPRGTPLFLPFLLTHVGPEINVSTCCPLGSAQLPATPSSRTFPREVLPADLENLVT